LPAKASVSRWRRRQIEKLGALLQRDRRARLCLQRDRSEEVERLFGLVGAKIATPDCGRLQRQWPARARSSIW